MLCELETDDADCTTMPLPVPVSSVGLYRHSETVLYRNHGDLICDFLFQQGYRIRQIMIGYTSATSLAVRTGSEKGDGVMCGADLIVIL
jgi:hypothetical protein